MVSDLLGMLIETENASLFITIISITLVVVTYSIGRKRSVTTGGFFAGMVAIILSTLLVGISDYHNMFAVAGLGILGHSALLFWLGDKKVLK